MAAHLAMWTLLQPCALWLILSSLEQDTISRAWELEIGALRGWQELVCNFDSTIQTRQLQKLLSCQE
jgi:hypothetical protein